MARDAALPGTFAIAPEPADIAASGASPVATVKTRSIMPAIIDDAGHSLTGKEDIIIIPHKTSRQELDGFISQM